MGTPVVIQNQTSRYPTKWDKTGVIVEIKPHSQLVIKVDGSRRLTLRNRRFVRKLMTRDCEPQHRSKRPPSPTPSPVSSSTPSQITRQDPSPRITNVPPPSTAVPDLFEFKEDPEQPFMDETDGNVEVQDMIGHGPGSDMTGVHNDEVIEVQEHQPAGDGVSQPQHEPVTVTRSPTKPSRTRKPNVKYSSNEYDLSLVRHKSRRQIRRAN